MAFNNRGSEVSSLSAAEVLWVQLGTGGVVVLVEGTAPSAIPGSGQFYVKSSDSQLYFKDSAGVEHSMFIPLAASVSVGTTTTLLPGASATVVNSGTASDAILDFGIPAGVQGDQGIIGLTGSIGIEWKGAYIGASAYVERDAVSYNGSSYYAKQATTGNLPTDTTYWDLIALKGADGAGSGSVTTVSVSTANGFAGTSDGDPANPTITLVASVVGILKSNGTAMSAATPGTDYQAPINFVDAEIPTGDIDGVNISFLLTQTPSPAASLIFTVNGQVLAPAGVDLTLTASVVALVNAPPGGSTVLAWYRW